MKPSCYRRRCDVKEWLQALREGETALFKIAMESGDLELDVEDQRKIRPLRIVLDRIVSFDRAVVYEDGNSLRISAGICPIEDIYRVRKNCPVSQLVLGIRSRLNSYDLMALHEIIIELSEEGSLDNETWCLLGLIMPEFLRAAEHSRIWGFLLK